jgi:hypothetical protein
MKSACASDAAWKEEVSHLLKRARKGVKGVVWMQRSVRRRSGRSSSAHGVCSKEHSEQRLYSRLQMVIDDLQQRSRCGQQQLLLSSGERKKAACSSGGHLISAEKMMQAERWQCSGWQQSWNSALQFVASGRMVRAVEQAVSERFRHAQRQTVGARVVRDLPSAAAQDSSRPAVESCAGADSSDERRVVQQVRRHFSASVERLQSAHGG